MIPQSILSGTPRTAVEKAGCHGLHHHPDVKDLPQVFLTSQYPHRQTIWLQALSFSIDTVLDFSSMKCAV